MDQTDFLRTVGSELRKQRKAQKLSQEQLAELANLHPTYVSEIERGKVNASIYTFYQLAVALRTDLGELLGSAPSTSDKDLDSDLFELNGRIRRMEPAQRKVCLMAIRGLVTGVDDGIKS